MNNVCKGFRTRSVVNGSKNANTWSVFRKLRQDVEVSERRRPGRSEHDVRDWKASPAPAITDHSRLEWFFVFKRS